MIGCDVAVVVVVGVAVSVVVWSSLPPCQRILECAGIPLPGSARHISKPVSARTDKN